MYFVIYKIILRISILFWNRKWISYMHPLKFQRPWDGPETGKIFSSNMQLDLPFLFLDWYCFVVGHKLNKFTITTLFYWWFASLFYINKVFLTAFENKDLNVHAFKAFYTWYFMTMPSIACLRYELQDTACPSNLF